MNTVRWLIRLLIKYGKIIAVDKVAEQGFSIAKAVLKARVVDIPGEVTVLNVFPNLLLRPSDFRSIDMDFNQKTVYKNFEPPKVGKYKLVSFCPVSFPHGVRILEMLSVAALRLRCFSLANLSEVLSVEQACDFKVLGLGENYNLVALGTVVKRPSAWLSLCYPVVIVNKREVDGKQTVDRSLQLRDLTDSCPAGCHFLFRVK